MKKIKNASGVINTVTDEKFEYLMGLKEGYEEVKARKPRAKKEEKKEAK